MPRIQGENVKNIRPTLIEINLWKIFHKTVFTTLCVFRRNLKILRVT